MLAVEVGVHSISIGVCTARADFLRLCVIDDAATASLAAETTGRGHELLDGGFGGGAGGCSSGAGVGVAGRGSGGTGGCPGVGWFFPRSCVVGGISSPNFNIVTVIFAIRFGHTVVCVVTNFARAISIVDG